MLVYIIDGFNLIHKLSQLMNSHSPCEDLIQYIRRYKLTGSRKNRVCIVFDGRGSLDTPEREFEIIFSGERTADELILQKLARLRNKRQAVIVTDDRQIRDAARGEGAQIVRCGEFTKRKKKKSVQNKAISYSLQREITEELRNIWLKDKQKE